MQTMSVEQLRADADRAIAAAQESDVFVVENGKVVAIVTRPRENKEFVDYWRQRETLLEGVIAGEDWDSAKAISDDRDRA